MIPILKVPMSDEATAAVGKVLASGMVGQGPVVDEFEAALAERVGNPRVATVNSATSGLHLALHMVAGTEPEGGPGGQPGEVLTTPLTMVATNWAILANRVRLRWVDVDPGTLNVDLDDLARKISPATRAIVIVHFTGYPVDLARLSGILDEAERRFGFRPMVIEDCAHAWGARYRGEPLGNHGNVSVFSFQAVKHLTCGDGGLMVLPDDELHRRAKLLRWFGIDREAKGRGLVRDDVAEWGFKFHMNDINAAIGLANLDHADEVVRRHQDNAAFFDRELAGVPGLELTERAEDRTSSFWVYPVKVDDMAGFMARMKEAGITAGPVQERNDRHSCVRQYAALLPGMDEVSERLVCLPVGWWVTEQDRQHIVDTVKAGW
ncbi:DegT/DnrJ/EryC1/StrS family aminotransferase [Allonocardiopsis opalescens]|uniref:dTDP-4-amino-4,6-dideoxygalactose transaminase n=1 Tax=Allonocardiopsis opalescens TaxID=1144618 RepID=A0A2T0QCU0_9ACTN|nr:DegT/DnrJ/EryC1/StrS family aminotransferase [Allonocardiopsis opalescens]PRY01747.1 dTDP-4-amino-4,6-dideoxygalactose transaminase [Allonocardiopsis opalescens]